jgi:hypothetical protein
VLLLFGEDPAPQFVKNITGLHPLGNSQFGLSSTNVSLREQSAIRARKKCQMITVRPIMRFIGKDEKMRGERDDFEVARHILLTFLCNRPSRDQSMSTIPSFPVPAPYAL